MTWRILEGDCVAVMAELEEASVDAVVTDPPYGLHFMGKTWDQFGGPTGKRHTGGNGSSDPGGAMVAGSYDLGRNAEFQRWCTAWATEALRVLKPGGHLLSFGGTRTYHRLACALEDAGFEIRDCLAWLYGSGFPKSLDVSKAIDRAAGAEREVVGEKIVTGLGPDGKLAFAPGTVPLHAGPIPVTAPATEDARAWQGWGTALKPAFEPIVLARKPLSGTVAENVLRHGTGALNVDGTRIGDEITATLFSPTKFEFFKGKRPDPARVEHDVAGRWPANVVLDEEAAALLDEQSGELKGRVGMTQHGSGTNEVFGKFERSPDAGGASRFFYTAKTSRAERENGIVEYGEVPDGDPSARPTGALAAMGSRECNVCGSRTAPPHWVGGDPRPNPTCGHEDWSYADVLAEPHKGRARNHHPTVKPVDLMQWLCRLVTPPKGLVMDPFLGSGSTGMAALREGFDFIGIERESEYVEIARARIIGDAPLFNAGGEVNAEANSP